MKKKRDAGYFSGNANNEGFFYRNIENIAATCSSCGVDRAANADEEATLVDDVTGE